MDFRFLCFNYRHSVAYSILLFLVLLSQVILSFYFYYIENLSGSTLVIWMLTTFVFLSFINLKFAFRPVGIIEINESGFIIRNKGKEDYKWDDINKVEVFYGFGESLFKSLGSFWGWIKYNNPFNSNAYKHYLERIIINDDKVIFIKIRNQHEANKYKAAAENVKNKVKNFSLNKIKWP